MRTLFGGFRAGKARHKRATRAKRDIRPIGPIRLIRLIRPIKRHGVTRRHDMASLRVRSHTAIMAPHSADWHGLLKRWNKNGAAFLPTLHR